MTEMVKELIVIAFPISLSGLLGLFIYLLNSKIKTIEGHTTKIEMVLVEVTRIYARQTELERMIVKIEDNLGYLQGDLKGYLKLEARIELLAQYAELVPKLKNDVTALHEKVRQLSS